MRQRTKLGTLKSETRLVTLTLGRGVLLIIIIHLNVIINLSFEKSIQRRLWFIKVYNMAFY